MSIGGSSSKSSSQNTSSATSESMQASQSQSGQSIAFADLFQQLYGKASGAAGTAVAGAGQLADTAQQLFTGGTSFLQGLGNDAGTQYLNSRVSGEDTVLSGQLDQLREQTGQLYREELNPATVARNVAGGTLGGGRQGVAEALDREKAAGIFSQGATSLIASNQAQKDTAATNVMQGSLQAASTGLGSLQGLFDLSQSGNNAELGVYSLLSSILGGPTTLTNSSSSSIAKAFSEAIAQGTSKSSSFGFNLGLS